ncbi:hypothetical protein [Chenggangzhangella methanolivorans]|uniref:Uncharacterized protein n=1 Tax=Chenggangzhangella methanolivorans TaxID=1437009 RepID=A0A9E6R834_9HYPH|nr:hypothetical protein [Chenggangzhangella methanolivorans]QZN99773.1 hypothetical protein K6K41_24425 [Chenggangzhangella methanolivorans]
MSVHSILFKGPMVRALLDGTKTQTRRALSRSNTLWNGGSWPFGRAFDDLNRHRAWVDGGPSPSGHPGPYLKAPWAGEEEGSWARIYPKVQPGDHLWVRETWSISSIYDGCRPRDLNPERVPLWCGIRYAATQERLGIKDRAAIHMPRWASRLTLEVTEVRVERLQDISEADAIAEGVAQRRDGWFAVIDERRGLTGAAPDARSAYAMLWDRINGAGAWDANPWVAVYGFTVQRRNVDQPKPDPDPADCFDIEEVAS